MGLTCWSDIKNGRLCKHRRTRWNFEGFLVVKGRIVSFLSPSNVENDRKQVITNQFSSSPTQPYQLVESNVPNEAKTSECIFETKLVPTRWGR